MSVPQLRPLDFGEILDGAFTLYRRHFFVLFATTLIPFVPMGVLSGRWLSTAAVFDPAAAAPVTALSALTGIVGMVATMFILGALSYQLSEAYSGGPVTVGAGLRRGLRALLPLMGAAILAGLGIVLLGSVLTVLVVTVAAGAGVPPMVLAPLGLIATFVIFIFATAALFGVGPVVVVERKGPWGALKRSWQLSRGGRLRILAVLIVAWIVTYLPVIGVTFVASRLGAALIDPAAVATLTTTQLYLQQAIGTVTGALTFPFLAGCLVLLYYDRRVRVDGYDVEVAAAALATTS